MIGEKHNYAYEYSTNPLYNGDLLDDAFNATMALHGYTATTLYERDGTNPDTATIVNEINMGFHEIILNGQHGNPCGSRHRNHELYSS